MLFIVQTASASLRNSLLLDRLAQPYPGEKVLPRKEF